MTKEQKIHRKIITTLVIRLDKQLDIFAFNLKSLERKLARS